MSLVPGTDSGERSSPKVLKYVRPFPLKKTKEIHFCPAEPQSFTKACNGYRSLKIYFQSQCTFWRMNQVTFVLTHEDMIWSYGICGNSNVNATSTLRVQCSLLSPLGQGCLTVGNTWPGSQAEIRLSGSGALLVLHSSLLYVEKSCACESNK